MHRAYTIENDKAESNHLGAVCGISYAYTIAARVPRSWFNEHAARQLLQLGLRASNTASLLTLPVYALYTRLQYVSQTIYNRRIKQIHQSHTTSSFYNSFIPFAVNNYQLQYIVNSLSNLYSIAILILKYSSYYVRYIIYFALAKSLV